MFFQGLQESLKGQGDQVPNVLSITKRAPSMVKVSITASLMGVMSTASLLSRPQGRLTIGEGLVEIGCQEPIRDQDQARAAEHMMYTFR